MSDIYNKYLKYKLKYLNYKQYGNGFEIDASQINILVICQRVIKDDKSYDNIPTEIDDIKSTNKYISGFVKSIYSEQETNIYYLSTHETIDKNNDLVDFNIKFALNEETYKFVQENNNKFSIIIFNTCPLHYMLISPILINWLFNLLLLNGRIYFKIFYNYKPKMESLLKWEENMELYGPSMMIVESKYNLIKLFIKDSLFYEILDKRKINNLGEFYLLKNNDMVSNNPLLLLK